MDELAKYNKGRWEALAQANVIYSRPYLDLDPVAARTVVDPQGVMGDVAGKHVLCLAAGGGQQSVAFALLGAQVTVFDLAETQLQRDREAAAYYDVTLATVQGDMRDLSCFDTDSFDIVWQAYSINFVPDAGPVFDEVARVLRPGGLYRMEWSNPFICGLGEEDWDGKGYPLQRPYVDGAELTTEASYWDFEDLDGTIVKIDSPREFRHTLSSVLNRLAERNFVIRGLWEKTSDETTAVPGSWEHFIRFAPPWLTFWASYRPDL